MGFYKRLSENKAEIRRYNAARRKAQKFSDSPSSRLIRMETISEIERFNLAQDADKLTAFNKEVEHWQDSVTTTQGRYRITQFTNSPRVRTESIYR